MGETAAYSTHPFPALATGRRQVAAGRERRRGIGWSHPLVRGGADIESLQNEFHRLEIVLKCNQVLRVAGVRPDGAGRVRVQEAMKHRQKIAGGQGTLAKGIVLTRGLIAMQHIGNNSGKFPTDSLSAAGYRVGILLIEGA